MKELQDPRRLALSTKETRNLLAQGHFVRDDELSEPQFGTVFYNDDKGGLLLVLTWQRNKGVYFFSRAEYIAEQESLRPGGYHMLENMIPEGERFPETVPAKIDELAHILNIPRPSLDLSPQSIQRLDRAVRRHGQKRCLEADIFPLILAYTGQYLCQATGGRWEMTLDDDDGKTWEPNVRLPSGERLAYYVSLYKGLLEDRGPGLLSGRVFHFAPLA